MDVRVFAVLSVLLGATLCAKLISLNECFNKGVIIGRRFHGDAFHFVLGVDMCSSCKASLFIVVGQTQLELKCEGSVCVTADTRGIYPLFNGGYNFKAIDIVLGAGFISFNKKKKETLPLMTDVSIKLRTNYDGVFTFYTLDLNIVCKITRPDPPPKTPAPPPPRPPPTAAPPVPVTPVKQPQPTPTPPTQKTPEPVTPSGEPIVILFEKV